MSKIVRCPLVEYDGITDSSSFHENNTDEKRFEADTKSSAASRAYDDLTDTISYAFQLSTAQGPLCNEPVQGLAVFIENITITTAPSLDGDVTSESFGRATGEIIKITRDSIRQGFLDWSPRLLLALYSCEIQASSKLILYPAYTTYN